MESTHTVAWDINKQSAGLITKLDLHYTIELTLCGIPKHKMAEMLQYMRSTCVVRQYIDPVNTIAQYIESVSPTLQYIVSSTTRKIVYQIRIKNYISFAKCGEISKVLLQIKFQITISDWYTKFIALYRKKPVQCRATKRRRVTRCIPSFPLVLRYIGFSTFRKSVYRVGNVDIIGSSTCGQI